jgi:hypothetical protein
VIDLLVEELRATLRQVGAGVADARTVRVRHEGALRFGGTLSTHSHPQGADLKRLCRSGIINFWVCSYLGRLLKL